MGRLLKLRDLIGTIKDKASLSKAVFFSNRSILSLHLAVLRATKHSPSSAPPEDHHLSTLLALGDASRATASALITALMDRLHETSDSTVAMKCLLIIHHIVKRGSFILQDQLSVFPATGGHNYLNLSAFRDNSTATAWTLSAWVRWYARYLESLLSSSRVLGYLLLCSSSSSSYSSSLEGRISSLLNLDLIKEVTCLVTLTEEISKVADNFHAGGNMLLYDVMELLGNDYLCIVNELLRRLVELKERLSSLCFGESIELICGLKRLDDSKERMFMLFKARSPSIDMLWDLVDKLKHKSSMIKVGNESSTRKVPSWEGRIGDNGTESARFSGRALRPSDSVRFASARLLVDSKFSLLSIESGRGIKQL